MQNKAKLPKSQMNISEVLTKNYEKKTLGEHGKNKPKTNPNKAKQTQNKAKQTQNKANFKPGALLGGRL